MGSCGSSTTEPAGHDCKKSCLISRDCKSEITEQILISLRKYNAEYLSRIIISYLCYSGESLKEYTQSTTNLKAYVHQQALSYYLDELPPCKEWRDFHTESHNNMIRAFAWGSRQSGKSCLLERFCWEDYIEDHYYRHHDPLRKSIKINDDCSIGYDLIDPNPDYPVQIYALRESQIMLLCFGIDEKDPKMFDKIDERRRQIMVEKLEDKYFYGDFCIILVATKCDLLNDKHDTSMFVDHELIMDYASKWDLPYIQVSAKTGENVDTLFHLAVYEYWIQSVSRGK